LEDKSFDDLIAMVATRGGITEEGAKMIEALSPEMFRQLFSATSAKHRLVKDRIGDLEE
jgi:pyrroline-5-carboxylate reductase